MEFWVIWVITAMTVVGTVLALLVARETYLNSTRRMSVAPQRALLRSSRELMVATVLLVLSVSVSLYWLVDERGRRLETEHALQQLRASLGEDQVPVRSDGPSIEPVRLIENEPTVPVPIQDREDLALIEAVPEPARAVGPLSSANTMRVTAPSLNLRTEPEGTVIRSLPRGHRLQLVRERVVQNRRWAQVRSLEIDVEGWVSRSAISAGNPRG